jgi:hypothetical protein
MNEKVKEVAIEQLKRDLDYLQNKVESLNKMLRLDDEDIFVNLEIRPTHKKFEPNLNTSFGSIYDELKFSQIKDHMKVKVEIYKDRILDIEVAIKIIEELQ